MERCIYNLQILLSGEVSVSALLQNGHHVVIRHIRHESQRIITPKTDGVVIRDGIDIAYNLFRLPRNELAAKLVIYFVTVILFRIVAGSHNNTRQRVPEFY